ncbi:hypothetical protein AYI69_g9427 [Smittium culicis]|uniref:Uncharacterized protein n=1 Tax=Smittium culicis TaxID=133412 RepID=A0A1R1XCL8_9FUNG|nr:hypothetical protein AYI69_g9427 [Smittium culicis]
MLHSRRYVVGIPFCECNCRSERQQPFLAGRHQSAYTYYFSLGPPRTLHRDPSQPMNTSDLTPRCIQWGARITEAHLYNNG